MIDKLVKLDVTTDLVKELQSLSKEELTNLVSELRLKFSQMEHVKNKLIILAKSKCDDVDFKKDIELINSQLTVIYVFLQKLEDILKIILTLLEEKEN